MEHATIFNIQRYSLHDGPGIRTTVFFKGCPLNCQWCQNPEGIAANCELFCYGDRCIQCGSCLEYCVPGAVSLTEKGPLIDRDRCNLCLACIDHCPSEALKLAGREISVEELLSEVLKDRIIYEESGGGVTASGGEPLLQAKFLIPFLRDLKHENIHSAVETSGCTAWITLDQVAAYTDLFIYDLKLLDEKKSKEFTGAGVNLIADNLRKLVAGGNRVWVRMPLIPTINNDQENLRRIADLLEQCGLQKIEIIPYHNLGSRKYNCLDLSYSLKNIKPPGAAELEECHSYFDQRGITTLREVE